MSEGVPGSTADLLTDYLQAMEVKDFDRLGAFYAENITQTFANAPTITERDTMLTRMRGLLGRVTSLAHPLTNVWQGTRVGSGRWSRGSRRRRGVVAASRRPHR